MDACVVNAGLSSAEKAKMAEIMSGLRKNPLEMVGNYKVAGVTLCAEMPSRLGQKEASF